MDAFNLSNQNHKMDSIQITGLRLSTHIGVHDFEQKIKQPLFIDMNIPWDISKAKDALEDTLDYDQLCQMVKQYVENRSFKLIETVANDIAALIKSNWNVAHVCVSVSKPHALNNVSDIRVTVNR